MEGGFNEFQIESSKVNFFIVIMNRLAFYFSI
jgi:hypothetical protein